MEEDNIWLLAYRYPDMASAGEAYARATTPPHVDDVN